jgi:hypothetical protein
MTLTPATVIRLDLKPKCGTGTKACGQACIPQKHNCHQGVGKKAAAVTAVAGFTGQAITSGAAIGALLGGDTRRANRLLQANAGFQALTAAGVRGVGLKKEANKMLTQAAVTGVAATALAGDFNQAGRKLNRLGQNAVGRAATFKGQITRRGVRARQFKRKDSVYADGFTVDYADLAV